MLSTLSFMLLSSISAGTETISYCQQIKSWLATLIPIIAGISVLVTGIFYAIGAEFARKTRDGLIIFIAILAIAKDIVLPLIDSLSSSL